jgi:hypothetical protein
MSNLLLANAPGNLSNRLSRSLGMFSDAIFAERKHRWAVATSRMKLSKKGRQGKQAILIISVPDEIAVLFNALCDLIADDREHHGIPLLDDNQLPSYLFLEALRVQASELLGVDTTKTINNTFADKAQQWASLAFRAELSENEHQGKRVKIEIIIPDEIVASFERFCDLFNHDRRRQGKTELDDNYIATALLLSVIKKQAMLLGRPMRN